MEKIKLNLKKVFTILMSLVILLPVVFASSTLTGCSKKEKIIIYTSLEDYRMAEMESRLNEKFPEYNIIVEYLSTGDHAAKLYSEGTATECDITHDLDYAYLEKLDLAGYLADLSSYDKSIYVEDTIIRENQNYIVECRSGGAIIVNKDVIASKNLPMPTCYADLLKPEYKNLISMPSPKASGTGFMFFKNLVNTMGEDAAVNYFKELKKNVIAFTSSGSGPVNALKNNEAAIGLGMTAQAVNEINNGYNFEVLYFEEGSPFTLYGQSIIKGKEERACVKEVFDYLINEYNYVNNELFYPEKIYKDKNYESGIKNHPTNIIPADMSNNTIEEKERLLALWDTIV